MPHSRQLTPAERHLVRRLRKCASDQRAAAKLIRAGAGYRKRSEVALATEHAASYCARVFEEMVKEIEG